MVAVCFAVDCDHKARQSSCSFFRFPTTKLEYTIWTVQARRGDRDPSSNDRLCSCHFKDGKKENGPTIFNTNRDELTEAGPQNKKQRTSSKKRRQTTPKVKKMSISEAALLEKGIDFQTELNNKKIYVSFSIIESDENLVFSYTGLPNAKMFYSLVNYCKRFDIEYFFDSHPVTSIAFQDQIFITLQILRKNYSFRDFSIRYSVHQDVIKNIFYTFLHIFHEALYKFIILKNIPDLDKIQKMCPSDVFSDCRFLVDCIEVNIENPEHMKIKRKTPIFYIQEQPFKGLIAVAPNGALCFASNLYPKEMHDKEVIKCSGLLELLQQKDLIIAHRAHSIHNLLPKGVSVNIPPFLLNVVHSVGEIKYTRTIERASVHVQRSVERIKCFSILHRIPNELGPLSSIIFQVCSALVNFQSPFIKFSDELS
ncbi:uncharacterized protein LOC129228065 [Uloborus diversus]|uniref:uncharacterized protein LOC129228065 n=1 Tax=Uloborus diversus TaxID=327109 RepID=UPI00240A8F89|nr:uncharacterized protein LOC129228065 [Uloborus diversus]